MNPDEVAQSRSVRDNVGFKSAHQPLAYDHDWKEVMSLHRQAPCGWTARELFLCGGRTSGAPMAAIQDS